jgi:hypothetical protein
MSTFLSKVHRYIVDEDKVGDIYILVFIKMKKPFGKSPTTLYLLMSQEQLMNVILEESYYISQLMQSPRSILPGRIPSEFD